MKSSPLASAGFVQVDFGNPGQGAKNKVVNTGLGSCSHGNRIAIAVQAGIIYRTSISAIGEGSILFSYKGAGQRSPHLCRTAVSMIGAVGSILLCFSVGAAAVF